MHQHVRLDFRLVGCIISHTIENAYIQQLPRNKCYNYNKYTFQQSRLRILTRAPAVQSMSSTPSEESNEVGIMRFFSCKESSRAFIALISTRDIRQPTSFVWIISFWGKPLQKWWGVGEAKTIRAKKKTKKSGKKSHFSKKKFKNHLPRPPMVRPLAKQMIVQTNHLRLYQKFILS